jgi:hypothetical protein
MASMLMSIVVRVYPHEKPTIRFIPKLKSKELFFFIFFFSHLVKNPDQSNTKTIKFICKLVKSKGLVLFFFFLMKSSVSQHEIHQIFIPKKKSKGQHFFEMKNQVEFSTPIRILQMVITSFEHE